MDVFNKVTVSAPIQLTIHRQDFAAVAGLALAEDLTPIFGVLIFRGALVAVVPTIPADVLPFTAGGQSRLPMADVLLTAGVAQSLLTEEAIFLLLLHPTGQAYHYDRQLHQQPAAAAARPQSVESHWLKQPEVYHYDQNDEYRGHKWHYTPKWSDRHDPHEMHYEHYDENYANDNYDENYEQQETYDTGRW